MHPDLSEVSTFARVQQFEAALVAQGQSASVVSPSLVHELAQRIDAEVSTLLRDGDYKEERMALESGPGSLPAGGSSGVSRVSVGDVRGYFKPINPALDWDDPEGRADHEVSVLNEAAAWQLALRLGPPWALQVPPTVIREFGGRLGSFQLERQGRTGMPGLHRPDGWEEAAVFDQMIGNTDRHPGNILIGATGRAGSSAGFVVSLIDHGETFPDRPGRRAQSVIVSQRPALRPSLSRVERAAVGRLASSTDLLGIAPILSPDQVHATRARCLALMIRDLSGAAFPRRRLAKAATLDTARTLSPESTFEPPRGVGLE